MDVKIKLRAILQSILYNYPLLYPASLYLFNNVIIIDDKDIKKMNDNDVVIDKHSIPYISTMAVDNLGRLYINKAFFDSLDIRKALFIYLHEVLHFVLRHNDTMIDHILPKLTGSSIDQSILMHLANLGMDMAVNSALKDDLQVKIDDAVYPEDFGFEPLKSFEYYFARLLEKFKNDSEFEQAIQYFANQILKELENQLQCNNCCNNNSSESNSNSKKNKKSNCSSDNNNDLNDNNRDLQDNAYVKKLKEYFIDQHLFDKLVENELRKQMNEIVKKLIDQGLTLQNNSTKNIGKGLEQAIREFIDDYYTPKVNWKNILKVHLDIIFDNRRRTFIKPNRKISAYIVPGYVSDIVESINPCILIDLSGSITNEEFSQFIQELLKLFKTYKTEKIRFIAFTSDVVFDKAFEINKDDKLDKDWIFKNVNFNHTGGTSIYNALKRFEEDKNINICIVFTDCEIDDWYEIKKPNKHIFVISTTKLKAPYYKTIHI